jgi:hypothetical protein
MQDQVADLNISKLSFALKFENIPGFDISKIK